MNLGGWTVVFARTRAGAVRKYNVSRGLALCFALSGFLVFSAVAGSGVHWILMQDRYVEYANLVAEVDQLRKEKSSFLISARQLDEQTRLIDNTTRKLEITAGFTENGTGVGGPDESPHVVIDFEAQPELKGHFEQLDQRRFNLQRQLNRLQDHFTSLQVLMASTPAIKPLQDGRMGDGLGWRRDPITGQRRYHRGLDISAPKGTCVVATAPGRVIRAGWMSGYGKLVVVEHRFGIQSYYGHLYKITAKVGQQVDKQDIIGYVGQTGRATGNHVHYEVRLDGEPLDPFLFFRER